jgi:sigma-B regulation protein RsbU (phosphoserine phosphatase)
VSATWDLLTGDAERDRRNVRILMESVEDLYGQRSLPDLQRLALDRAIRVTGAQVGLLLLDDGAGGVAPRVARSAAGADLPLTERYSHTVVEAVWKQGGRPFMTVDALDRLAGSVGLGQSVFQLRLLSIMAVPLPVKGRNLGVLYVHSTVSAKEFGPADFAVLQALGGIVALAVENARLLEEQAARQRLQREMDLARRIQTGLLPKDIAVPAGLDLAADWRPCEDTSGDYYDAIPLADGRLALVVGDVSGHGLGPALFMASTRAQVHALVRLAPDPVTLLGLLNTSLVRDLPPGSFMTLWLGLLDPASRTLTYASAGHNPPLLVQRGGLARLMRTGPPLGVVPGFEYGAAPAHVLGPGDALVLYTDGIYEAQDAACAQWGDERFETSLLGHARKARSAREIVEGVLADLARHVGSRRLDDDVTCLVLRVQG